MITATLHAEKKQELKKSEIKTLRRNGFVPGVVYGEEKDPVPLVIERKVLEKLYRDNGTGRNTIIELQIEDGKSNETVLSKSWERDPITSQITHVDFIRVNAEKKFKLSIPVKMVGEAIGKKHGGILIRQTSRLDVVCLPSEILDQIEVDVTTLGIGDSFRVSDLNLGGSREVLNSPATILALVESKKAEKSVVSEESEDAEDGEDGEESAEGTAEGGDSSAESAEGKG